MVLGEVCPRIDYVCLLPSSLLAPKHPNNARASGSFPFDRYHVGAEWREHLSCPRQLLSDSMHSLSQNSTCHGSRERVPSEVDSCWKLLDEGVRDTAQS